MHVKAKEFELLERDFDWVCSTMHDATGIQLTAAKYDLVYNRLARRLRALGLQSFEDYRHRVEDGDEDEMVELVNALTTNVTSFFREAHHFEFLAETVLPDLLEARGPNAGVRVWSAGCSSGQEPYSVAFTLHQALPPSALAHSKILATDLDTTVLEEAQAGVYPAGQVESLSPDKLQAGFLRGRGAMEGMVRVKPELQALVTFRQLNLMLEPWPFRHPFDVIFCRNVIIYFSAETQQRLFRRFASALRPGGYLCLGHSESASGAAQVLEPVGRSVYRRVA